MENPAGGQEQQGGGSTLTQQLVKNAYGIAAAARRYFQKEPAQLTVRESAALIASLKGNSRYDPRRSPERNSERADRTLRLMADAGYLTPEAYAAAFQDPLCVNYFRESPFAGLASHFTVAVRQRAEKILTELGYDPLYRSTAGIHYARPSLPGARRGGPARIDDRAPAAVRAPPGRPDYLTLSQSGLPSQILPLTSYLVIITSYFLLILAPCKPHPSPPSTK